MLLQMAIALTIASCAIEWILYYNFPRLVAFTHGKSYRDIILSLGLSAGMGICFGANGVVIMIAGAASTALSPCGMPFIRWAHANKEKFPALKLQAKTQLDKWLQALINLAEFTYAIIMIVTWPVRAGIKLANHPTTRKALQYAGNSRSVRVHRSGRTG